MKEVSRFETHFTRIESVFVNHKAQYRISEKQRILGVGNIDDEGYYVIIETIE